MSRVSRCAGAHPRGIRRPDPHLQRAMMIARAESGQARGNMDDFDAADVAQGIHELYEPLAEDSGLTLQVKTEQAGCMAIAELISQALANLVENAIKYGQPAPARQPLSAEATSAGAAANNGKDILIEAAATASRCCSASPIAAPAFRKADRGHAIERFVRLEARPHPARLRARPKPRLGGCDAAWRRAEAR